MEHITKNGYVFVIDSEDCELVLSKTWHGVTIHGKKYIVHSYKDASGRCVNIYLHRFIFPVEGNIDHVNGNGLDNRKSNLREVTQSENMMNSLPRGYTVSGYKGVSFHTPSGKWLARITINRKTRSLGLHPTKELAASAYNETAKDLFGDYARLNVVND
jgi:hypothetical protein